MSGIADLRRAVERRVDALPSGLQSHIHRTVEEALELAGKHGIDAERVSLAVLAHDVARAMSGPELLRRAAELRLPVGPVEKKVPVLLHGPVGAGLLKTEDGLDDREIYDAVYWHTTGHPSLGGLGKVVFLADKLDPQKGKLYPYQSELKKLALEDLDRAVLEFLTRETLSLVSDGRMVHPMMVETRNHLLANRRSL